MVAEDVNKFVCAVPIEVDSGGRLEATSYSFLEVAGRFLLIVGGQHLGEATRAVAIVQHLFFHQLVDFVQHDHVWVVKRVTEAVEEFISRRGLAVDIECAVETFEDAVDRPESGVVLSAVAVLRSEVDDFAAELLDGVGGAMQVLPVPLCRRVLLD